MTLLGTLLVTGAGGLLTSPAEALPGDIDTVAGNGIGGYGGDGGPATSASLSTPYDIAVDPAGNYYIADGGNCRIRKVNPLGTITTVAGNGICGFSGDGGAATSARLDGPRGVALDAAGNLYIADSDNCRIRRVLVGLGTISTVAGNGTCGYGGDLGSATSASLNIPRGVAVDAAGNLYIADTQSSRVRRVTGGIITTVAGNGFHGYSGDLNLATTASLHYPYAVATDGVNLYIADTYNCRVRLVAGAVITTVVGNGSCASGGDFGLAVSASVNRPTGVAVDAAEQLYVGEADGCRVRQIRGGVILTVAGGNGCGYGGDGGPGTSAQLSQVRGVEVDAIGNVFIADLPNNRVRRVELTPTLTTTPTLPPVSTTTPSTTSTTLVPSGATAMTLTPPSQTRATNDTASLTAHVVDESGNALAGASVSFVVSGANPQAPPPVVTDANGDAVLTYVGTNLGNDVVQANVGSTTAKGAATVAWQSPAAAYHSDTCTSAASTNVVTGFVDGDHVTLRTDSVGGQTWVCVHADDGTVHAGGKAVVSGAVGVPAQDDDFGACDADPANRTVNEDGFVGPVTFEVDVNQYPTEVWVCVTLMDSTGNRVIVPTSGTPTVNFLSDSATPFPYGATPAPVGEASSACQEASSGRTRLVNADVGTSHVWAYTWQESLTRAHACVRVQGATDTGGRLTLDGGGSQTFVTTDASSDFTPCDTPIAGTSTPPLVFKAHAGLPAWVCGQVLTTFLRVKLDNGGSQGIVTFTEDT